MKPFLLMLILCASAAAQTISTITVTPPTGTLTSPHFVIDQDTGIAPETRNKIPVSVTVTFPRISTGSTVKCRVIGQLLTTDGKNTAMKLETGSELSAVASVSFKGTGTGSQTFTINLDPVTNLGVGIAYKVRAQLQTANASNVFSNLGNAVDSAAFSVVHFAKEAASHLNVKVHASAAPTLTRGFALKDSASQNAFTLTLPLLFSRYDPGDVARTISYRLTTTLLDDLGNTISLASGSTVSDTISAADLLAFNSATPNRPDTASKTVTLSLRPQNQLDSVNRTYRVRVVAEVDQGTGISSSGVADAANLRLLHFNGTLNFGTTIGRVTATTFTQISNTPAAGGFKPNPPSATSLQTNGITTTLSFSSGVITSQPDLQFGSASQIPVILLATGQAVFAGTTEFDVTQAIQSAPGGTAGNIRLSYQNLRLRSGGLVADVKVHLPQGLGFTANRGTSRGKFKDGILVPDVVIDSTFGIGSGLVLSPLGSDAWVFDESRPLLYRVNGLALNSAGVLDFLTAEAQWAQKPAFDQLALLRRETRQQAVDGAPPTIDVGFHPDFSMNTRPTNDGYLKFAGLPSPNQSVKFVAATVDGTARTDSASLKITPGSFEPHLPSGSVVEWGGIGDFQISAGKVNVGTSRLPAVPTSKHFVINYDTGCRRAGCDSTFPIRSLVLRPAGAAYKFTPDGGLQTDVGFPGGPLDLAWDARLPASTPSVFSHKVLGFTVGSLMLPGHQVYAFDSGLNGEDGAAAVSLAGFFIDADGARMIYPGSNDYLLGLGSYAGANFTSAAGNGEIQEVRIGDMVTPDTVNLAPTTSKYYARRGGVSGRTVASNTLDALSLYGYPFSFSLHQLAFLSNGSEFVREPSRINGQLTVKRFGSTVTAFTQPFVGLNILCQGALGDAAPDPNDQVQQKDLFYWNGSFRSLGLQFVPTTLPVPPDGDCVAGPRELSLLMETQVANLVIPGTTPLAPLPIVGSVVFKPDGNLGTLADKEASGVDSRLGLPATVHVKGPGEELYRITPVSRLYFNNPAETNAPNIGFAGFAGLCQVPFFQDMQVHVVTSATAASTAFSLFMTGGWTEGGQTYFTHENFDLVHRGLPPASLVSSFDAYRNPTPAPDGTLDQTFLARAKQSVFGVLPLDYPLRWQPLSRDFIGVPQDPANLLVLTLEHQLRYLSADNAELTFGAEFEDLKRLNLANIGTEALERVHRQAHGTVNGLADKLVGGVNKIDDLVSDNIDKMIDKVTEDIIPGIAQKLYDDIEASYNERVLGSEPVQTTLQWLNDTTNGLERQVTGVSGQLQSRLGRIAEAANNAASFNLQIVGALDQVIRSLDIVAGRFRVDTSGVLVDEVYQVLADGTIQIVDPAVEIVLQDGLIRETLVDGETQRQIVKLMVQELLRIVLENPEVRGLAGAAMEDALARLDDELNALLVEADPTLDRIQEVIEEIKTMLTGIRNEVARSRGMIDDLRDAVAQMQTQIQAVTVAVLDATTRRIRQVAEQAQGAPLLITDRVITFLEELAADQLGQFMREQLRDRLMESGLIQNLQHILRQHIAELRMAVHGAIDQVYAEVNKIVREVVNKVLGDLEKQINGVIGPMADTVGAGSIDGYAHIEGDTLRRLRLDAEVQLRVPDPLLLKTYFEMMCYDSATDQTAGGGNACPPDEPGQRTVEVRIGALDVPLEWKPAAQPSPASVAEAETAGDEDEEESEDLLRADLGVWFSFDGAGVPNGLGGSFTQTAGKFDFDSVVVSELVADVGIGTAQAYLGARARVKVSEYEGFGGVFFGRTCSDGPLRKVDPDVADILGDPPFTGAYVYGEVWVPISEVAFGVPATCMFRVSAGVGAGVFYFAEGPVYGGRLKLGVTGEALCAVTIAGDIDLLGALTPEGMKFRGIGTISGSAGECPLCLSYSDSLTLTYEGGVWDAKF